MPFSIPNALPGSSFQAQAQGSPDSVDFDILTLGYQGTGTVSGCAVSVGGSGLAVTVQAGVVAYAGVPLTVGGTNVPLATADPNYPRFDLIVVTAAGNLTAVTGVPSGTNPVFPSVAGQVCLAAVYVPALAISLTAAQIVDKRVQTGPALLARVAALEARCDQHDVILQKVAAALWFLDVDIDMFDDDMTDLFITTS